MAGDKVCDGSNNVSTTVLLQKETIPCDPIWISTSSASLHDVGVEDRMGTPFFQSLVKEENDDEDYDVCLNPPGKKRRLTTTQVQFLERNFEIENRLEPERKMQLAKELGLQPRQVAIWFQNRRARFKNKQLEKDYGSLKASYDKLKADYENLLKQKDNLKNEFVSLTEKLLAKEQGVEHFDSLDAINSVVAEPQDPMPKTSSENGSNAPKKEDASSAKGDAFDSDSPRSFLEPADSSNVFEADQSDVSQDEEDDLSRSFLPSPCFPKLYHDPPTDSCSFEFPTEDQPFWCWSY